MRLSARLWADNGDLAAAALAHPFVRGLADGSLPREIFAGYVAQDAFFLESFARAYALALARSPDRPTLLALADLLAGVREELGLHASYAARWGIDLAGVEPAPATLAYTEFLLATAATGGLGEMCAAMTPCMRLYAWLGAVARRERCWAVRGVGADLRRPELRGAGRPAGGAARRTRRRQSCRRTRPTGGRCAWSWSSSTRRSQAAPRSPDLMTQSQFTLYRTVTQRRETLRSVFR